MIRFGSANEDALFFNGNFLESDGFHGHGQCVISGLKDLVEVNFLEGIFGRRVNSMECWAGCQGFL